MGNAALKAQNALMESYQSAATDLAGYEAAMATQNAFPTQTDRPETVEAEATSEPIPDPSTGSQGGRYKPQPKPNPIPKAIQLEILRTNYKATIDDLHQMTESSFQ